MAETGFEVSGEAGRDICLFVDEIDSMYPLCPPAVSSLTCWRWTVWRGSW